MCFDSPSKKAKKLKNSNKRNQNDNSNASADSVCDGVNVNDDNTTPQYLRISMLMAAIGKGVGGNQTGFRLLDMRSYAQKNNLELIDILNLQKETQNNWEHLKKLAENRSFRSGRNGTLRQGKKRVIGEHSYSSP